MTKIEILLVRGCKSKNPKVRLKSLYKRFYYYEYKDSDMIIILVNICDKYCKFSNFELVSKLAPQIWNNESFETRALNTLISKIRFSKIEKFKSYIPPAKFRNIK